MWRASARARASVMKHDWDRSEIKSLDFGEALRALTAPRRNNYFYGKRLDVPQFRMEQDYGKEKRWLLNRLALGKGVVCGLKVTAANSQLCVSPGVAIEGRGR